MPKTRMRRKGRHVHCVVKSPKVDSSQPSMMSNHGSAITQSLPRMPSTKTFLTHQRSMVIDRKTKLTSPPPPCDADDELTEYDSQPAALHTNRKRARPPSSPTVVDLRSPIRIPMPSATDEQILRWSHSQSPTAYMSPGRQPAHSTFSPPDADQVQTTSASTSIHPPTESADLKVFCAMPTGKIAAMTQAPKRLMWDSGVERGVNLAYGI
jgi:hypothetical protein